MAHETTDDDGRVLAELLSALDDLTRLQASVNPTGAPGYGYAYRAAASFAAARKALVACIGGRAPCRT